MYNAPSCKGSMHAKFPFFGLVHARSCAETNCKSSLACFAIPYDEFNYIRLKHRIQYHSIQKRLNISCSQR